MSTCNQVARRKKDRPSSSCEQEMDVGTRRNVLEVLVKDKATTECFCQGRNPYLKINPIDINHSQRKAGGDPALCFCY